MRITAQRAAFISVVTEIQIRHISIAEPQADAGRSRDAERSEFASFQRDRALKRLISSITTNDV